ncbi:MAG TPA: hypothetical protein VIH54_06280, partial [Chthoniobacterales bacterium]
LLFFVSVDPFHSQSGFAYVPLEDFGLVENDLFQVEDLLTGEQFEWRGRRNFVLLNPSTRPAHLFRIRRPIGRDGAATIFG